MMNILSAVVLTEHGLNAIKSDFDTMDEDALEQSKESYLKASRGIFLFRGLHKGNVLLDNGLIRLALEENHAAEYFVSLDTFTPAERFAYAKATPTPHMKADYRRRTFAPAWVEDCDGLGVEPLLWWMLTDEQRHLGRVTRIRHSRSERHDIDRDWPRIKEEAIKELQRIRYEEFRDSVDTNDWKPLHTTRKD